MIDWDEITLSDPIRDIGLLLWWYVPQKQWLEFFDDYGLKLDKGIENKIYWWAAEMSLSIVLWNKEHGYKHEDFLEDLQAALNKKSNPHFEG